MTDDHPEGAALPVGRAGTFPRDVAGTLAWQRASSLPVDNGRR